MTTSARSLFSADTVLCADSIEFDPSSSSPGLFVLGTYQVDQQEQEGEKPKVAADVDDDEDEQEEDGKKDRSYTRRGRLTVHQIVLDEGDDRQVELESVQVETLGTFDTSAILDLKWSTFPSLFSPSPSSQNPNSSTLALADARGSIHFYSLLPPQNNINKNRLAHRAQLRLNPHDVLCLSLDWSDRRGGGVGITTPANDSTSLIVSQSDGTLVHLPHLEREFRPQEEEEEDILPQKRAEDAEEDEGDEEDEMDEDDPLAPYQSSREWEHRPRQGGMEVWRAHEHEAWIAAWDCWSSGTVAWSGGDDCKLVGWDMRTPIGPDRKRSPIFSVSRGFDGGVTAMQSSHLRQHIWAVGSYDSHIRIFDARSPRQPITTHEVSGGLWRTKWHPTDPTRLLLGCMHGGFTVVKVSEEEGGVEVVRRFEGHGSLAYGCDWERGGMGVGKGKGEGGDTFVASCSFYDHQMHVWSA
ncbi:hypothetical protein A4X13_0g2226 [Tilletia indica]|uniref:methylated diphthine methylhydrolase n=1 Tax=Tilletia indica TaxID=43049 RepID=A0A177TK12_9BASI|nr:hypothetical protein A4X13_0g2226 [Tilletia indica]